jgi:hypothetical protein
MGQYCRDIMRWFDHLGTQGWLLVLAAVILVGVLCLRGFGSRSEY